MDKHHLKETEARLAKHVAAGHGKENVNTLRDKANDADLSAREASDDGRPMTASGWQRTADHYDSIRQDLKDAKRSVKEYGSGHDMSHHGEGKPHKG